MNARCPLNFGNYEPTFTIADNVCWVILELKHPPRIYLSWSSIQVKNLGTCKFDGVANRYAYLNTGKIVLLTNV